MALPPVLSNLPILKLFRSEGHSPSLAQPESSKAGGTNLPRDVVELSESALKKLNQSQDKIRSESQARDVAEDVRDDLADTDQTLGLDEAQLTG